jgi:hypothetical protein
MGMLPLLETPSLVLACVPFASETALPGVSDPLDTPAGLYGCSCVLPMELLLLPLLLLLLPLPRAVLSM